jgi:gliding motility-associated-like protein
MKNLSKILALILVFLSHSIYTQIVINEVMVNPAGGSTDGCIQSLANTNSSCGSEYVELYNTDPCNSFDLSCYVLGSTGFTASNIGAISFPIGTIVPPLGHLVVGGPNSSADFASIDIVANDFSGTDNLCMLASRWFLENQDGWVGLYAPDGTPTDAVYWTSGAGQQNKINTAVEFSRDVCTPDISCNQGSIFVKANEIAIIEYLGASPSAGLTFSRIPDGGNWQRNIAASVNNTTVGNCNGGTCNTSSSFQLAATVTQPSCSNNDGQINFNPSPNGTYTYTWTPNVSSSSIGNNLSGGTYNVVIELNGCTKDTSITLTSSSGPTAIVVNTTNATCGQSDGEITLGNVTGGTAPYTYNFNNLGFAATTNFTNLTSGSYSLVVEDANACVLTAPVIVLSDGNGPSAIVVNTTNPECGLNNGTIDLGAVTGGAAPYTYSFNGGAFGSQINYSNLAANTYTLVVTDNAGCIYNAPDISLTNSSGPTSASIDENNPSCGLSNGSILVNSVTGGQAPYEYDFNGQGFTTNNSLSSLNAGTFTMEIRDANGCLFSPSNVVLTNSSEITNLAISQTNPTCGQANGSVTIGLVTGGTAPFEYDFNNLGSSTTTNYSTLASGTFPIIVSDAFGCSFTTSVTLANSNAPNNAQIDVTDEICNSSNGEIEISNISGGVAPYQVSLNSSSFSSNLNYTGLNAGNYTLTIEDNLGCTFNAPTIVVGNQAGPSAITTHVVQPSCGFSNGSIQVSSLTGGLAPYEYNFNGQGFTASNTFLNQNGGTVSIEIRDANACVFIAPDAVLTNSAPIVDVASVITEPSCGQSNGSISLGNVSGGTVPYQYDFNNLGFANGTNYQNLPIGLYSIVVSDALGCTFSTNYTLTGSTPPVAAQIDVINANCGNIDGTISISNIIGGSAPYQVSLNGLPFSQNLFQSNLTPGDYTIIIEDANACQYATQASISSSSNPLANFILDNNEVSIIDPIVNASNFSSADVVSFLWISNAASPSTSIEENPSFDFSLKEPGFYPVTLIVENSDGCKDTVVNYLEFIEEPLVFVPNTFTPDGNEINNTWEIVTSGIDIMDFNLLIFNRWGQLIWESNDASVGWDGTYNNRLVASGIYTWKISAKDKRRSTTLNYNGFVNVMY